MFPSLPKDHDCERVTKISGEVYLGEKKTIATIVFFIIADIRIYCQMDAAQFEGLLYTILSVPSGAKGLIRYFGIFHHRAPGLTPHFRKLENFRSWKIYVFRPTHISGISRYWVMFKSPGVIFRVTSE